MFSNFPLRRTSPYLLIAPAITLIVVALLAPVLFNLVVSLFEWNLLESDRPQHFVGLKNFIDIFSTGRLWNAVGVTATLTVASISIEFTLGFLLALLVEEQIRHGRLLRTLLVAPLMATPLVVGLVFRLMWHSQFGVINWAIGLLGVDPVPWLAQPHTAMIAIVVVEIWHNTSFVFLVLLGAMQMLPKSAFDAAEVEGATYWQRVRYITLPMLKPAILVAILFRMVFTIRIFDEIWSLTKGGPGSATESVSILIYKSAFEELNVGRAASLSITLLFITAALATVLIRVLRSPK